LDKYSIGKAIAEIVGSINVTTDEPMKNHTSFQVGGPADIYVTPESAEHIIQVLEFCRQNNIPFFIMGRGSNLIVRDGGMKCVVIDTSKKFNNYTVDGETITADAGILLSKLANIALKHSLSGLEFASGIPGTLGGAVVMNAGAYGGEMSHVVEETLYIDRDGKNVLLNNTEHEFGYRSSILQKNGGVVLRTKVKLKKGDAESIKDLMNELNFRRKENQPLEYPSAGSIFKRPPGYYTGKLIEECGLKGYKYGGAEVSAKHCGFIVNTGGATAGDIINLIEYIKSTVMEKYGVLLETEVKIVGED